MTREEFIEKFRIADKVIIKGSLDGYMKILFIGSEKFFGVSEHQVEMCIRFLDREFDLYEEPEEKRYLWKFSYNDQGKITEGFAPTYRTEKEAAEFFFIPPFISYHKIESLEDLLTF
jgi:hypothetical protein